MTDARPKWQDDVIGSLAPEAAAAMIEMVEACLDEDVTSVLRQLTSDLILDMRAIRNLTLHVQQQADAEIVLFHEVTHDGEQPVTAAAYAQRMLDQVAEVRQMLDTLKFYTLALAEEKS
jgi:selenocysteine lyase/cysteine desulfurase